MAIMMITDQIRALLQNERVLPGMIAFERVRIPGQIKRSTRILSCPSTMTGSCNRFVI